MVVRELLFGSRSSCFEPRVHAGWCVFGDAFWSFGELVMAARSITAFGSMRVSWFLPVLVRFWNVISGGLEPMVAIRSEVFLSFSLLRFQLHVFYYGFWL